MATSTSIQEGSDKIRAMFMAGNDRFRNLLYEKGRWYGVNILSNNFTEESETLLRSSGSNGLLLMETNYVYRGNPILTASARITYCNSTSTTYQSKISVGYMNDSNTFTLIGGNDRNSSTTVPAATAKEGYETNGYYIQTKDISLTGRSAAIGKKVVIRLTNYFAVWRWDKIWIEVSRL